MSIRGAKLVTILCVLGIIVIVIYSLTTWGAEGWRHAIAQEAETRRQHSFWNAEYLANKTEFYKIGEGDEAMCFSYLWLGGQEGSVASSEVDCNKSVVVKRLPQGISYIP